LHWQIFEDKENKEDEIETGLLGQIFEDKTKRKMKSKPQSGPSVNLSGVTKEIGATGCCQKEYSWACLFWFEIETPFWSRR
jgi:hypothetical protein